MQEPFITSAHTRSCRQLLARSVDSAPLSTRSEANALQPLTSSAASRGAMPSPWSHQ